jgi:hypothetical protein
LLGPTVRDGAIVYAGDTLSPGGRGRRRGSGGVYPRRGSRRDEASVEVGGAMQLTPHIHLRRPEPGPFGRRDPSPFAPIISLLIVGAVIAAFVFLVVVGGK